MANSIIKLKNVSKFYYSKGVVASGFSKINLEFQIGEFVAITGESGSGKSTLLNVISGLDTYEEGEMYINGEETSHYTEDDFEDYRRRYIGNIFQNFNLVNSYTVYQNIELVLLLNGAKSSEVKDKVLELIDTVNLTKFKNTKVSKLSGGQKQRVAIARALAKDTPIIIADEPTGNLDSKSAKEIIKLLSKISKDKLVIIVTHNYDQVEEYVTRKIKMHDGKVLEDRRLKEFEEVKYTKENDYENIRTLSKIRLAIRNTFNIVPKFLLVLLVYLFIAIALLSEYSSFKEQEYLESKNGYNAMFTNISDKRIVIKKKDGTTFTKDDYDNISKIDNVDYVVNNDLFLDVNINLTNNNYWLFGTFNSINNFDGKLDKGRMPEADNEVVVVGDKDNYSIGYSADEILNKDLYLQDYDTGELDKSMPLKIVGIKYEDDYLYDDTSIYVSDKVVDKLTYRVNENYSNMKILFQDKYYTVNNNMLNFKVTPNENVKDGEAYISNDVSYLCKNEYCINKPLSVEVSNIYYSDSLNLKVTKTYTKNNIKDMVGVSDFESANGSVFISVNDYNKLFNKDSYQSSVFVIDHEKIDATIASLEKSGIDTLKIGDTLVSYGDTEVVRIFRTVVTIILVVVLIFISYFVIRVILKSRNIYFTTIRMLGANKKISRQLLIMELLNDATLAYIISLVLIYLNKINVFKIGLAETMLEYLKFNDYVILYILLIIMSYLISIKFAKKLFKNSAMKTLKEEA